MVFLNVFDNFETDNVQCDTKGSSSRPEVSPADRPGLPHIRLGKDRHFLAVTTKSLSRANDMFPVVGEGKLDTVWAGERSASG